MNEGQGFAAAAQSVGDAPTEPRAVDGDDGIGPQLADSRDRLANPSQDNRRSRQYFGYTPDGKLVERREADETLLLHALATDPGDPEIPFGTLLQCCDQRATKHVARGFTGDKENE
jgi:hypothetical protein